ncbi:hypothetical protein SAMN04487830_11923 [Pseudobutyrivibrio sp. OR37]|uniref:hypothetical protein n=1 Tax=Pseudobutyrivibrio sp. OR37 TaxID=1798186 RepID=UPI0008EA219B|nr:hypothetical protein [Pseudobutyrivibrio sp. OR37]SFI04387.1 hypothetical protein SAMN04487830_11923 [Pseudobutyrivibrio sp. OR37]
MLAIIIFLLVISAFSFFAAFRLGRTFESTMPISCMGIVLFLFLCGMCNLLGIGWIIVCVAAVAMYVYTFYWIGKNGVTPTLKKNIFNLITPGTIIFAVLAILIAYFNKDRLAMHTDEFSHWLDTVVIMTGIDAFGTAPGSTAIFPSYPPAMSLFQYLLEKINMTVTGDFAEWKVYYAYQLFAVSVMIWFAGMKDMPISKKLVGIISWPICLFIPLYFFAEVYSSLYIDPFLGILGGCGFAAISVTKNKDWLYSTYVGMLCAVLTISKDVGIYLAMFVSLYYFIDYISRNKVADIQRSPKSIAKYSVCCLIPMLAMIAAKLLWKIELAVSDTAQKFSQPFDIAGTIDTIKGNGSEFYTTVYDNFRAAITYRYIYYERIGFNYTAIMFLFVVAFVCLHVSLYRRGVLSKASAIAGAIVPGIAIIAYILSMFPLYISRFVEEEAINLASFDRYCGIMFLTGMLLMFWLLRDMLIDMDGKVLPVLLACLMLLSVRHSKLDDIDYYVSRRSVEDSLAFRQNVNALAAVINSECQENARILVIGESSDDLYTPVLSTICKPRWFMESSVYFNATLDENDEVGMSVEDFKELLKNNFDYVAIYSPTEAITDYYASIFANGNVVDALQLYKVDNQGNLYQ